MAGILCDNKQVDEAVDVSSSLLPPSEDTPSLPQQQQQEEDQEGGKRRRKGNLYKCMLTDGFQQVVALDLDAVLASNDYQPGGKVSIGPEVEVRRGALLLRRSQLRLLGGGVSRLQALAEGENTVQPDTAQGVPPPSLPAQLPLLLPPSQTALPSPSISTSTATGLPAPIPSPVATSSRQTSSIAPMATEVDVDISWDDVEWMEESEIVQAKPLQSSLPALPHHQQEVNKIIELVEEEEWEDEGKKIQGEQGEEENDLMENGLPVIAKGKNDLLPSEALVEEEGEKELNVWDFSTSSPLAQSPPASASPLVSAAVPALASAPVHVSTYVPLSSLRTFQQLVVGVCLQGPVRCFASRLLHCSPQEVVLLLDDGESLQAASLSVTLSQEFLDRISSPSAAKVALMSREGMMCFQRFSGIFLFQRNGVLMTEEGKGQREKASLVISEIIALHGEAAEPRMEPSPIAELCRAMLAEDNLRNDDSVYVR